MAQSMQIGVQLYTLRDQTAADLPGVLKALKQIGYAGAELAGFGSLKTASEVRKAFDDAGLTISGAHVSIDALEKDVSAVIADHKTLANTRIVIPWLDQSRRTSADDYRKLATFCNDVGQKLAAEGIQLGYHNHDFEFQKFDDTYALDILWQHTDPQRLKSELDVFWVAFAGVDPVSYIKQLGQRLFLVHLKDLAAGADRKFAPVGEGTLDFRSIASAAQDVGVQWGLVEQDDCYGADPLKNVELSFRNLQKLGIA